MDRSAAEALASRAYRIALTVLGGPAHAAEVVVAAASRGGTAPTTREGYEFELLRSLVDLLRARGHVERDLATEGGEEQRGEALLVLQRLSVEDRLLIALCSIEKLSYKAAARLMATPEVTILERLAKARRRMWQART